MIFRRLIWAALAVAMLVGGLQSGLQQWQTMPIILAAEGLESQKVETALAVADTHAHGDGAAHDHGDDAETWTPADGVERQIWTWVANVLHAFSMALLVLAVMAVCQWRGSALRALPLAAWVAAAGWLSFHFWPSLGLHAEIPGMDAARLGSRQGWWVLAAGGAALACASVALMRSPLRWIAALVWLGLPFLVGVPHITADPLAGFTGEAQAALRQLGHQFVWATTWLSLSFWVSIGALAGLAFQRWLRPAVALVRSPLRWAVAAGWLALPFVVGAPHIMADPLAGFTREAQVALRQLGSQFIWTTAWLSLSFWLSIGVLAGLAFQRWLHPAVAAVLERSDAGCAPAMKAPQ